MSVIVKGLEMPENCGYCKFHRPLYHTQFCVILNRNCSTWEERKAWCPLSDVPTPHGRLIDADALKAWFVEWYDLNADLEINHFLEIISEEDSAPTIIEAEE